MTRTWRLGLLSGLAVGGFAPPSAGQDLAAVAAGPAFETIIVTARKREEDLQSVPIAVTTFSAADLLTKNVQTLADLRYVTPAVSVQPDTFRQDTINVTIRGLRNFPSNGIQFDTAAAIYVNGIYVARAQGLTGTLFDVESVEVLKGPQGTLVGRNATGGAILYRTREPEPEFGGSLTLTGGDYGRREAQGVINVPLGEKVFARAALSYSEFGGYLRNIFVDPATGERNDTPGLGYRKSAGLFSVKFEADDTFDVVLRGDFDAEHHTGTSYHLLSYFEGTAPSTGTIGDVVTPVARPSICNIPMTCNQYTDLDGRIIAPYFSNVATRTVNTDPRAYNALLNSLARQRSDFWSVDQAVSNYNTGHFQSVSGTVDKTFGDVSLRVLGGYRWTDTAGRATSRGAPYHNTQFIYSDPDYAATTAEATLNGTHGALQWTAGAFYFRETARDQGVINSLFSTNHVRPQPVPGRQVTITDSTGSDGANTSYAVYAQATYSLGPDLRVTGGARYTIDKRRAFITQTSTRFPASVATTIAVPNSVFVDGSYVHNGIAYAGVTRSCALTDANGALRPVNDCSFDVRRTFRDPTWTLAVDYDLTEGTLIYATARRGYKSGAINSGATNAAATVARPERVQDYEIGLKSDWTLGAIAVRTNLAAYMADYADIQVQMGLPYVVFAVGPGGAACSQALFNAGQCTGVTTENVTLNARSARLKGFEWEVAVKPSGDLTLSWNGSYLHTVYDDFSFTPPAGYLQPASGANLTGQPFPLPAWTMSASATYALSGDRLGTPVNEVSLTGSAYLQGRFKTVMTNYHPSQQVKGYALANLRLDLDDVAETGAGVAATVSNLFNKKACLAEPGGTGAGGGAGVLTSTPNATFGVPNTSGLVQCVPLPPRMFQIAVRYVF
jgi:iron complex outermembrane receptor protein